MNAQLHSEDVNMTTSTFLKPSLRIYCLLFSHNQVKGCFEILNHMLQRKVISSSYDNFHTRGDDLFMKFVILAEVTVYLPAQDVLLTLPQSLQNSDIFAFRGELHCTLSLITKSLKIT